MKELTYDQLQMFAILANEAANGDPGHVTGMAISMPSETGENGEKATVLITRSEERINIAMDIDQRGRTENYRHAAMIPTEDGSAEDLSPEGPPTGDLTQMSREMLKRTLREDELDELNYRQLVAVAGRLGLRIGKMSPGDENERLRRRIWNKVLTLRTSS